MVLNSNIIGNSDRKLVILHGLYGNSDSWARVGESLSNEFTVHLPDLRNHGKSFRSDVHSYPEMANDLKNYLDFMKIDKAYIVGHSMGGKLVMSFAEKFPEMIEKMVVADISPRSHTSLLEQDATANSHLNLLSLMKRLNLSDFKDYRSISKEIESYGPTVKNVVLKSIGKNEDGFFWRINVNSLFENLNNIFSGLNADDFIDKKIGVKTLFFKAENSNYITDSDVKLINFIFTNVSIQEIKNAGHWLHFDNPVETTAAIRGFFN